MVNTASQCHQWQKSLDMDCNQAGLYYANQQTERAALKSTPSETQRWNGRRFVSEGIGNGNRIDFLSALAFVFMTTAVTKKQVDWSKQSRWKKTNVWGRVMWTCGVWSSQQPKTCGPSSEYTFIHTAALNRANISLGIILTRNLTTWMETRTKEN